MKVLVADSVSSEGLDILTKAGLGVDNRPKVTPQELMAAIGGYDALIVRSRTQANAEVIKAGSNLKVIARAGAGVDNIDVEAATRLGVQVVNAPSANTVAVAEHVFGLMLSLIRHIPEASAKLKDGVWAKNEYMGAELKDKILGIIGLGKVGAEVAKRARAFDMNIIAYSPSVPKRRAAELGVKLVSLEELLKEADFITLHTRMSPEKQGMIGARELALVKPGARIINCARGAMIDEKALAKALEENRLAGAALDVYCQEPPVDSALVKCPNVLGTPHLAASTAEAQAAAAVAVAEQVVDVLNGRNPKHPVNTPAAKK